MAFALLILIFLAALVIAWLLCFPEARERLALAIGRRAAKFRARWGGWRKRSEKALAESGGTVRSNLGHWLDGLRRHRYALLAIVLLLSVPPLLVVGLRRHVMLDGYDTDVHDPAGNAALVADLMRGEQLVPPPALPPELFVTREVETVRPFLGGASREWDKLDPDFGQHLLAVFKIMKERYGYDMALLEGYRSPERQAMLAAKGNNVTNAGAYQSYHQYGLAADSAFYRDGKIVISERDPWAMRGYQLYGQVAEAAGLVWGGRWRLMDFGHVELHKPGAGPHAK